MPVVVAASERQATTVEAGPDAGAARKQGQLMVQVFWILTPAEFVQHSTCNGRKVHTQWDGSVGGGGGAWAGGSLMQVSCPRGWFTSVPSSEILCSQAVLGAPAKTPPTEPAKMARS